MFPRMFRGWKWSSVNPRNNFTLFWAVSCWWDDRCGCHCSIGSWSCSQETKEHWELRDRAVFYWLAPSLRPPGGRSPPAALVPPHNLKSPRCFFLIFPFVPIPPALPAQRSDTCGNKKKLFLLLSLFFPLVQKEKWSGQRDCSWFSIMQILKFTLDYYRTDSSTVKPKYLTCLWYHFIQMCMRLKKCSAELPTT